MVAGPTVLEVNYKIEYLAVDMWHLQMKGNTQVETIVLLVAWGCASSQAPQSMTRRVRWGLGKCLQSW